MGYIDYVNDFNRFIEDASFTDKAIVLYHALLDLFNRRRWPEWTPVDTQRLMILARSANKPTALRARDALANAGFIEYRSGKKGKATEYRLLKYRCTSDTENVTGNVTESVTESVTENVTPNKTKTKTTPQRSPQGEKRARFVPPTVEEVRAYCEERGNGIDPEAFVAFYESKGWKIGKSPMKSWKAAVITWEKRRKEETGQPPEASEKPARRGKIRLDENGEEVVDFGE